MHHEGQRWTWVQHYECVCVCVCVQVCVCVSGNLDATFCIMRVPPECQQAFGLELQSLCALRAAQQGLQHQNTETEQDGFIPLLSDQ